MIEISATLGDPTGIGPEVGLRAIRKFLRAHRNVRVHLFAPRELLPVSVKNLLVHDDCAISRTKFRPGRPSKKSGARALQDLRAATNFCIQEKTTVLVTGPLDKFICAKTLPGFVGHTEYLRDETKSAGTTMLLSGRKLTVALVTGHLSHQRVPAAITQNKIVETVTRTNVYLKARVRRPRLAVLGLNPHASDNGLFGSEEAKIIKPAIRELKSRGMNVQGPFSPDSFFHRAHDFDAVICMYHDQGLIPLKMLHFYDAVNITLGLPFLRVSVDHGTAFDIAGKNKASSLSYESALRTAYEFAKKTRHH